MNNVGYLDFFLSLGNSTSTCIFRVRPSTTGEKPGKKKDLLMAFVDLFDRVPREVIWWTSGWMSG